MKPLHLAFALFAFTVSAFAAPSLRIDKAADIAQQHLKDRGLEGSRYVMSLTLDRDSLRSKEMYWYARWSDSVKLEERKTELGIRINMDGSIVRMVEGPASQPKNYRTRSDRPSILDLK